MKRPLRACLGGVSDGHGSVSATTFGKAGHEARQIGRHRGSIVRPAMGVSMIGRNERVRAVCRRQRGGVVPRARCPQCSLAHSESS
jgi:hypothetical protein